MLGPTANQRSGGPCGESCPEPSTATAAPPGAEPRPVGWGFVTLYAVSCTGGALLFLAPLLVSLALKVRDLVGSDAAPGSLALIAGAGSLLAIVANPDSSARCGLRCPWSGRLGRPKVFVMAAAATNGSYAVLYAVAGGSALGGAVAVAPIRSVR